MEGITITRDGELLAHHTTESSLSHYGQPVWVVELEDPDPGPATWKQGDQEIPLEVIEARGGWLVCRQPDNLLCGIIWTDGTYHADLLVDLEENPVDELAAGVHVRGTLHMDPEDPEDLGAIVPGMI